MLLSPRRDHRRGRGARRGRRLLQAGARPHLRRRLVALRPGRAGRPGHRRRGAAARRPARRARRHGRRCCGSRRRRPRRRTPAHYAQHRRRARAAAAAHRRRGRHPEMALRRSPTTSTETLDRAEALVFEVAERRVSDSLVQLFDPRSRRRSTSSSACYGDDGDAHRRAHRLPRPRRACCSASSRRPRRSSPPVPGRARPAFALGAARERRASTTGKPVLFFSMEMGTSSSPSACSRPRRGSTPRKLADRQALRARLAEAQPRGRPARRGAVLHRRQPALHGDGDARQGPAHQGPLRRPRARSSSTTSS